MSNSSRQVFGLKKTATAAKVPEKSNFAHTCNLLSQYVKEKGGLKDLNLLGIAGKTEACTVGKSNVTTPTTMNLLSNVEDMGQQVNPFMDSFPQLSTVVPELAAMGVKRTQMTIFYGNQVMVFDDLPADKAREVMQLASSSCNPAAPIAEKYCSADALPPVSVSEMKYCSVGALPSSSKAPLPSVSASDGKYCSVDALPSSSKAPLPPVSVSPQPQSEANNSDLPIARRSSLHRFLEKRKDRAVARVPYHHQEVLNALASSSSKNEEQLQLKL